MIEVSPKTYDVLTYLIPLVLLGVVVLVMWLLPYKGFCGKLTYKTRVAASVSALAATLYWLGQIAILLLD